MPHPQAFASVAGHDMTVFGPRWTAPPPSGLWGWMVMSSCTAKEQGSQSIGDWHPHQQYLARLYTRCRVALKVRWHLAFNRTLWTLGS